MSSPKTWINLSPNLEKGISIINKLESKHFLLLLNKIVLELKQDPNTVKIFTDEEKDKLVVNFDIDINELNILIHSCIVILSQAIYQYSNPDHLKNILIEECRIDEEKANIFHNVWSNNAKTLILKLKQKSISPHQLEDVSWLVNVEIASQNNSQTFLPKAVLQLKLNDENGSSDVKLEMNEKDLSHLFNTLENIQSALDSLS